MGCLVTLWTCRGWVTSKMSLVFNLPFFMIPSSCLEKMECFLSLIALQDRCNWMSVLLFEHSSFRWIRQRIRLSTETVSGPLSSWFTNAAFNENTLMISTLRFSVNISSQQMTVFLTGLLADIEDCSLVSDVNSTCCCENTHCPSAGWQGLQPHCGLCQTSQDVFQQSVREYL